MMTSNSDDTQIGIVGCGAIGNQIARGLASGLVPGAQLAAVCDSTLGKAQALADSLRPHPDVVSLQELVAQVDLVVEAASAASAPEIVQAALTASKQVLVMSVGGLLSRDELVTLAAESGIKIIIPSGAIAGVDAVKAAAVGKIESVTITTIKPPKGLAGAPYIREHQLALENLSAPTVVFEGSALEAVKAFPANVNVAATLSLAGIGPEKTRVKVVADPQTTMNAHEVEVIGEFGRMVARTENRPSPLNPKTSHLASLSALAALRCVVGELRVGT